MSGVIDLQRWYPLFWGAAVVLALLVCSAAILISNAGGPLV